MKKALDNQRSNDKGGHEKTRERILSVAALLFAEKGFEGTSVRMICAKAGVNVSLVNYYFKTKELLYFEVHKLMSQHLSRQMPWMGGEPEPVDSLDEWESHLQGIIHGILTAHLTKDKYSACRRQLFDQEISRPSKCLPMLIEHFFNPFNVYLTSFIRLASPKLSEQYVGVMMVFVINQVIGFLRMAPSWETIFCPPGLTIGQWLESATRRLAHMARLDIEEELARLEKAGR